MGSDAGSLVQEIQLNPLTCLFWKNFVSDDFSFSHGTSLYPFVAVAKKQANHMCGSYGKMKSQANPDENRVEVDFSGDFDM